MLHPLATESFSGMPVMRLNAIEMLLSSRVWSGKICRRPKGVHGN